MSRPATAANPTTITGARYAARCTDQPSASAVATTRATTTTAATGMRSERTGQGYASTVEAETNYSSGDDYLVEFLGYSFSFNAEDFEQRVTAAAVKLGLLSRNELDEDETADRSEEHTSELQSQSNLVCRLLLEKKKKTNSDALHLPKNNT